MHLVQGNLWQELGRADLLLVTTNSTLRENGELVMGRGAALEARHRYPHVAKILGALVKSYETTAYGLLIAMSIAGRVGHRDTNIGALQTKRDWRDPADLALVDFSLGCLAATALEHPDWRIALNFPGIGAGGLQRADVLPLLTALPDNVYVYERK